MEVSGINNRTAAELGDADTVFADGSGASMAYVSNDAARFNPEGKTQDELLHDIMDSAEPLDRRYLYFGRFTDSFRTAMEKAGVEVKNLPVIMSYRDAYLAMESRENGRYQGQDINYHNLGIEGMKSAMENIGKPDAVMKSKRDGKIELFLDFVDYKGNRGLAIVQLDSNAQHAQEFIRANIVTSIYGKRRGDAYLEKAKSEGRLVYSKEEGPAQGMAQVQYESDINAKPSSTVTIRQTEGNSQEKSSGRASVEVENRGSDNGNADSDNGKREPKYTVIDGGDTAGKESALAEAYDKAVKQGKGVEISEADLKKYQDIRDDPEQTLIEAVKKYYEESLKGTSVEVAANNGVVEIRFENDGKKKSVGWRMKADKAATFEKLHQLTENAEYAYSEVNQNENERTSIPMFHYFVNNARIAGRDIPVKIQVRDVITSANSKETRYYTHTLEKNMRGNSGPVAGTQGANIDSNAIVPSKTNIRSTEGNGQEKSSGRAGVEVSGINNRMATELDGADTVFADGSISALSVERKITPETNEEARYEILKDRTNRPASVEYDKLGDTDTAAIYDGLSAAQMAQAKKAIRAIAKKLGLHQVDLKNSRIRFPFRFSNANAGVSAQHQSEYGGLYMTVAMTKIKESDVVKKLQAGESAAATSLLSDSNISIQDIFRSVKAGDGRFLKCAPDAFLNDAQKDAKWRAIQRQTEEYASYKIDGNGWSSVEVENRNTKTSEEDARRDFSPAGEPPRVHLAADSFCGITHALMPQKLRLRRNRSAFFCPGSGRPLSPRFKSRQERHIPKRIPCPIGQGILFGTPDGI